jgi:hypothetical protein
MHMHYSCLLEMIACGEYERRHIRCISHNPAKPDVQREQNFGAL